MSTDLFADFSLKPAIRLLYDDQPQPLTDAERTKAIDTIQKMDFENLMRAVFIEEISAMLLVFTPAQRAMFARVNPSGLHGLSKDNLKGAFDLCRRTLLKNLAEA